MCVCVCVCTHVCVCVGRADGLSARPVKMEAQSAGKASTSLESVKQAARKGQSGHMTAFRGKHGLYRAGKKSIHKLLTEGFSVEACVHV